MLNRFSLALCTVVLCACAAEDPASRVRFHNEPYPTHLSEWNLFTVKDHFAFSSGVIPYDLNIELFSDYAQKLRTLYIPPGHTARYNAETPFEFPTGTIVSKSFFYFVHDSNARLLLNAEWDGNPKNLVGRDIRLVETRLLVRQEHGWDTLPYIWHGDDATLSISGDLLSLKTNQPAAMRDSGERTVQTGSGELHYLVPSRNQCASCHATNHTTGLNKPIGLKARHLNKAGAIGTENQLAALSNEGRLTGLPTKNIPKAASWSRSWREDPNNLDHLARSYLDINCGHCHNPQGAADTSGLLLDYHTKNRRQMGVCKPPIAAGRGSGGLLYSIVPGKPEESILTFRMQTTDPGAMMPELGRALVHEDGVDLIRTWVASLEGECR